MALLHALGTLTEREQIVLAMTLRTRMSEWAHTLD